LLVVGAGRFQIALIREARALAEVVAIDGDPKAPGLALADRPEVIDIRDLDAVVALARSLRIAGVLTTASDAAVAAVAAVSEALGLPGLDRATAHSCQDKLACFERAKAAGLDVPPTRAVRSVSEARGCTNELGGFPIVIKPRAGGGGRGVSIVEDDDELATAFDNARRVYRGDAQPAVLVQAFVEGTSIGAEAFFLDGKLSELFVLDDQYEPGFVSPAGHSMPAHIDEVTRQRIRTALGKLGAALGLTTGVVNFDVRLSNAGVFALEVNPRLGGNSIPELVFEAYGVHLTGAAVSCALGHDPLPLLARKTPTPVAARLILRRMTDAPLPPVPSELRADPDLLALDVAERDGPPPPVVNGFQVLGRCVVRGTSASQAADKARAIAHTLAGSRA
jgi:biotin carboxylase